MPVKADNYKETEAILDKLRQAFSIDATIDEACFYAGINSDTYYRWTKANPSKYTDIEALRNTPILAARQTLATAVKTDGLMAMKYLERKRRAEFALRSELTGADGERIVPILGGASVHGHDQHAQAPTTE
jgi:hypothetical protein